MAKKVVLAYSGGLDTSAIVPWLVENEGCEVIAFVGDVGQGESELEGVEDKARASGASACYVVDLKDKFVEQYVWPTIVSGAVYEQLYLLGTSMARPVLAAAQVEIARKVGADAVAHGCTGKGNDQVRFEAAFAALAPDLQVIAPWRTWDMSSREELIAYCAAHDVPVTSTAEKIYSRDRNLWHISHEGGAIEDPTLPPPADAWMLTADPIDAPDAPAELAIAFQRGRPVAVDGQKMNGVQIIEHLNTVAGKHGVGRIDLVENRCVGMKSRGLYETPGGTVIVEALRGLEDITLDRATRAFKADIGQRMAQLVYDGRWFTPVREAVCAASESIADRLTGEVTVQLYKGRVTTTTRTSPVSLYHQEIASFTSNALYDQKHAEGFIRLFSLPERVAALQGLSVEPNSAS